MKTCKHCGSQLEEQAKFCRYCGKPAEEETPYNYQQQDTGYGYGGQQPADQGYQSSSYNQNYGGYQQQYSQPSYNQQAYNQQLYNQQPKTQMPESGNPVAAHQARPNTPMGAHRSSMATTAHSATTTDQMAR